MKRFLSIFLCFTLIFNLMFISFSYADVISELSSVEIGSDIDMDTSTPTNPTLSGIDNGESGDGDGAKFVGVLGSIISELIQMLLSPLTSTLTALILSLPTIDGCIFNIQSVFALSFFDANPVGLGGSLQASISAIYNAFRYLVTAAYIVILVYLAIRMMLSSVGRQKAHYKDLFKHWLVGLLLLFSFHWVMAFVIWLANTFVSMLANLATSLLPCEKLQLSDFSSVFNTGFSDPTNNIYSYPITAFLLSRFNGAGVGLVSRLLGIFNVILMPVFCILLLGSTFSIIVTYFKRLVTIAILIILFPLIALSYVFDKIGDRKAQTLSIWLKEFTVNVMLQPIHALVLVFISLLYSTGLPANVGDTAANLSLFGPTIWGAIMSIIALRLIPMGEELLKKLFQINSSMGPGAQGIAGNMAKAGLALQGAKKMAGELGKIGKGTSSLIKRRRFAGELYRDANPNRKPSVKNIADKKNFLKNNENAKKKLDDFTADICKDMGVKSLAAARAKSFSQVGAATFGVGSAFSGAGTGQFFSEAAAKAVLASGVVDAVSKTPKALKQLIHGDLDSAKDYINRAKTLNGLTAEQINNMDKKDKEKIATELGIHVDMVNGTNKNSLIKAYNDMALPAKYGANKDNLKKYNSLYLAQKNIDEGKAPDGSKLNPNNLKDIYQTKNGTFATIDGVDYRISAEGNRNLADGEKTIFVENLKGKSLAGNIDVLLQNHTEYNELKNKKQKLENQLKDAENERLKATITYEDAKNKFEQSNDDPIVKENFAKATIARDNANSKVESLNSKIESTDSSIHKIEKSEIENQKHLDKVMRSMGAQPYYANTTTQARKTQTTQARPDVEFTANSGGISDADISDLFNTNSIGQDQSGQNFVATYTQPTEDAFSYGICDQLKDTLEIWSNKPVEITLQRTSDIKLNYIVYDSSKNKLANGIISVSDTFNNDDLSVGNPPIIIVNNKNGWFVKKK